MARSWWQYLLPARFLRRRVPASLAPENPEVVFTDIFQRNGWRNKDSRSGPGSDLTQTEVVRRELPGLLQEFGCTSLLDAPCGDFFWMSRLELPIECYYGVDIVAEIVEENRRRYGSESRRFVKQDLIADSLPRADLVLCRDCLVHFPYAEVFRAVRNIKASGAVYLLTTTFPARSENRDIPFGKWRPLNLQAAPFSFPEPLKLINERCTHDRGKYIDKSLGLWRLADLPV